MVTCTAIPLLLYLILVNILLVDRLNVTAIELCHPRPRATVTDCGVALSKVPNNSSMVPASSLFQPAWKQGRSMQDAKHTGLGQGWSKMKRLMANSIYVRRLRLQSWV